MFRSSTIGGIFGFLLVASLSGAGVAGAQSQGDPDFLFGRPRGSVGVRGGWLFERAGSDLFAFVHEQLPTEPGDFDSPTIAFDLGVTAGPRTEAVFGVEFGGATIPSEYRDFVDNDRLPITQATRLRQANLSGSLKLALTPRGQEVGTIAWVPNAITPYVGAGAGVPHGRWTILVVTGRPGPRLFRLRADRSYRLQVDGRYQLPVLTDAGDT